MMIMLTRDNFNELKIIDRAELLLAGGNMLMTRLRGCYIVSLYRLEDFFVEVWYCQQTPRIHRIDTVRLEDVFESYEEGIDISGLNV
jgi:hypothetical protein